MTLAGFQAGKSFPECVWRSGRLWLEEGVNNLIVRCEEVLDKWRMGISSMGWWRPFETTRARCCACHSGLLRLPHSPERSGLYAFNLHSLRSASRLTLPTTTRSGLADRRLQPLGHLSEPACALFHATTLATTFICPLPEPA
jgi:hypothetical protein